MASVWLHCYERNCYVLPYALFSFTLLFSDNTNFLIVCFVYNDRKGIKTLALLKIWVSEGVNGGMGQFS